MIRNLGVLLSVSVLTLFFQNCSNARFEPLEAVSLGEHLEKASPAPSPGIEFGICKLSGEKIGISETLDALISNVGPSEAACLKRETCETVVSQYFSAETTFYSRLEQEPCLGEGFEHQDDLVRQIVENFLAITN